MEAEAISDTAARSARDLRVLVSRLRRRLKEVANAGELSPSQVSVVARLDRDGDASASDLAAAEGVRPQSMAAILAALDERAWLHRRPDPDDGRRQLISLTATARESLVSAREVRTEWLARAMQDTYTESERTTIAEALRLLERLTRL